MSVSACEAPSHENHSSNASHGQLMHCRTSTRFTSFGLPVQNFQDTSYFLRVITGMVVASEVAAMQDGNASSGQCRRTRGFGEPVCKLLLHMMCQSTATRIPRINMIQAQVGAVPDFKPANFRQARLSEQPLPLDCDI